MSIPSELLSLINFCFLTTVYLVPSLVGSTVSFFVKRNLSTGKGRKKSKKISSIIGSIFLSSILPAVIMTMLDVYLGDNLPDRRLLMGIQVLIGAVGEDVTHVFMNIKSTIALIKTISSGIDNLSNIEEMSNHLDNLSKNKKDEDKDEE